MALQINERFWKKVDKSAGPDGCWIWKGHTDKYGYGRHGSNLAHRMMYQHTNGPIVKGTPIVQSCKEKLCLNPNHLIIGKSSGTSGKSFVKKTTKPDHERFWDMVDKSSPHKCWIWTGAKNKKGYGSFYSSSKKKAVRANRFVYELIHGPISNKIFVCHDCPGGDNPSCVNPAHLWTGTHRQNMQDAGRKGILSKFGAANPSAKLNDKQVIEIMALKDKKSQSQIAVMFGVTKPTIRNIHKGKTWNSSRSIIPSILEHRAAC